MANKPKFLKNLLTTASVLAVVAGSANSAMGAAERLTTGNATINGGVNMGGVFNNGDVIKYGDAAHTITTGAAKTVGAINVNGKVVVNAIDIAHATTIGSIADVTLGAGKVNIDVNFAGALTLDGAASAVAGDIIAANVYTGLGDITLSNNGAILNINPNGGAGNTITLAGKINSNGGVGHGVINTGAGTVVFNGTIGDVAGVQKLNIAANSQVTLGANAKFDDTIGVGGIVLAAVSSKLTVNNGVNITTNDTNNAALSIDGTGGNGLVVFQGNSNVGIAVGTAAKVASIEINGTVDFQGSAKNGGGNVKSAVFNLNNAGAVMKLSTRAHTVEGNILNTTGTAAQGTLQLDGDFVNTVGGNIGVVGAKGNIAAVNFTTAGAASELFLKAGGAAGVFNVAQVTTDVNGKGIITFGLNAVQQIGDVVGGNGVATIIGTKAAKLSKVIIHSDDGAGGALTTVTLKGDATTAANASKIYATTVDLAGAARQNVLVLEANTLVDADVDTSNANNGNLLIKGDTHVTGVIGATAAINGITFDVTSTGKTFTVDGNKIALNGALTFNANTDATLALTNIGNTTITAANHTVVNTDNNGAIIANQIAAANDLKIVGKIGAVAGAGLRLLEVKGGGNIELNGADVHIKKIDIGAQDVALKLTKAGDVKIENFAHDNGKATLTISEDVTLKAGTVVSKSDQLLKGVNFTADKNLTLEDGVDIYALSGNIANTGIYATVPGQGKLTFKGTHTVDALSTNDIAEIHAEGAAGKTLTFKQAVRSTLIDVVDAGTIQFAGNVNAANIKGTGGGAAATGTIEFINDAAITVTGAIGDTNVIKTIKLSGGNVKVTGLVNNANSGTFDFAGKAATVLTLDTAALGANLVSVTAANAAGNGLHIIEVKGNQVITGANIGTDDNNRLDSIRILDDNLITINTKGFFSGVKTGADGKGGLVMAVANGTKVYGIGEAGKAFKTAVFDETGEVKGATFANAITIADGKTVTFTGDVTGNTLTLAGAAGGNAIFADGDVVNTAITNTANLKGNVTFAGATTVSKAIGAAANVLNNVTFDNDAGTKTADVGADIFAATTVLKKITFHNTAAANLTAGKVTANGTTFDLGENLNMKAVTFTAPTLKLASKTLTLTGASTATGVVNVATSFDGTTGGNLTLGAAADSFDATAATALNVDVTVSSLAAVNGKSFKLINANGGTVTANAALPVNITSTGSRFVQWTEAFDANKNLTLTAFNDAADVLPGLVKTAGGSARDQQNAAIFGDADNVGDAARFLDVLDGVESNAKVVEAVQRMTTATAEAVADVNAQVASNATSSISTRLVSVNAAEISTAQQGAGISAGADESLRYGAWGSPFYSQATQKARKGLSGYKVNTGGGTVGFDTMANDTMTVGAALTVAATNVKHKNELAGDKTKVNSLMFSIYGVQQLTDNWFLQGIASFGSSKVKANEKRVVVGGYQTATGKYDSMTYSGELVAGYNYKFAEGAVVTPMVGLRYSKFNDSGYKETGTTVQNRTISKKSTDKIDLIAGARVEMFATNYSGVDIAPEVHGFINHDFRGKSPKVDIRLDGLASPIVGKNVKPVRTFYNLGLGLNAKAGVMEYGIGYDAQLANKYVGHQGTLKVRVNF